MAGAVNVGGHGRSRMRKVCAADAKVPRRPLQPIPSDAGRRAAELRELAARLAARAKS